MIYNYISLYRQRRSAKWSVSPTTQTDPGTQSRHNTVWTVGHASPLCPHCELFFTRSSNARHELLLTHPPYPQCFSAGCIYHTSRKMSLASDAAHLCCPPGASRHSFWKQMDRLIPGLFPTPHTTLSQAGNAQGKMILLSIHTAKCKAGSTMNAGLCHLGGLIVVSAATLWGFFWCKHVSNPWRHLGSNE